MRKEVVGGRRRRAGEADTGARRQAKNTRARAQARMRHQAKNGLHNSQIAGPASYPDARRVKMRPARLFLFFSLIFSNFFWFFLFLFFLALGVCVCV